MCSRILIFFAALINFGSLASAVAIMKPNFYSKWHPGEVVNITWYFCLLQLGIRGTYKHLYRVGGSTAPVTIKLYWGPSSIEMANHFVTDIAINTPGIKIGNYDSWFYTWKVPEDISVNRGYVVEIQDPNPFRSESFEIEEKSSFPGFGNFPNIDPKTIVNPFSSLLNHNKPSISAIPSTASTTSKISFVQPSVHSSPPATASVKSASGVDPTTSPDPSPSPEASSISNAPYYTSTLMTGLAIGLGSLGSILVIGLIVFYFIYRKRSKMAKVHDNKGPIIEPPMINPPMDYMAKPNLSRDSVMLYAMKPYQPNGTYIMMKPDQVDEAPLMKKPDQTDSSYSH
ncbi:uncharacterized protein VTP21DRAFT_5373 [Calcarisporiella thermophila]|uniref:uncharacterized protein n=1 Tax=Calcarisporiella thermophila TaxID=911321 RepID=UPI00374398C0